VPSSQDVLTPQPDWLCLYVLAKDHQTERSSSPWQAFFVCSLNPSYRRSVGSGRMPSPSRYGGTSEGRETGFSYYSTRNRFDFAVPILLIPRIFNEEESTIEPDRNDIKLLITAE
jgi:hypothetical protein